MSSGKRCRAATCYATHDDSRLEVHAPGRAPMKPFSFQLPVEVHFGPGTLSLLSRYGHLGHRAALICGRSSARASGARPGFVVLDHKSLVFYKPGATANKAAEPVFDDADRFGYLAHRKKQRAGEAEARRKPQHLKWQGQPEQQRPGCHCGT